MTEGLGRVCLRTSQAPVPLLSLAVPTAMSSNLRTQEIRFTAVLRSDTSVAPSGGFGACAAAIPGFASLTLGYFPSSLRDLQTRALLSLRFACVVPGIYHYGLAYSPAHDFRAVLRKRCNFTTAREDGSQMHQARCVPPGISDG